MHLSNVYTYLIEERIAVNTLVLCRIFEKSSEFWRTVVQVRRFTRYNLGEGMEKKTNDFAAEVAQATGQA